MEPEMTTSPSVTVGPETRVIIVKPTFTFFTLSAPAAVPKPEPKRPESFDLNGAAEYLGITPRKLRELFKARRVAGSRIDYRHYLFTYADLNEFLAAYRSKPKRI
jgi:excisionase family DNA binding protein